MRSSLLQNLSWTRRHMPRLQQALAEMPKLSGMRLACSMHLDLKIVPLIEAILQRGAQVFLITCNPATVRDDVVAHLREAGAEAEAWQAMPEAAYQAAIEHALDWRPTHLCEVGADLSLAYHRREGSATTLRASLEATGSGIARLRGLRPRYPIFNWDDVPIKERLHNRHMVGLTAWHTFFASTRLTLHEKRVLIVGYGLVGQGLAATARAYGGIVSVAERDPARALEAAYDGWNSLPLEVALPEADVIVTATGASGVIGPAHFALLKAGAFLLNVGHSATEIDVAALRRYPHQEVLPHIEEVIIADRSVFLLAGGNMFNLTAGEGDSLNAFDTTLAIMARGLSYIAAAGADEQPGLYLLPEAAWGPVLNRQARDQHR